MRIAADTWSLPMNAQEKQERAVLVRHIRAHLKELARRLAELDSDKTVEAVHKARVACRRLRTALQVGCAAMVPRKRARRWRRRLRRLMQTLSPVRDADVQLAALEAHAGRLQGSRYRRGMERLALRLRQQRQRLQRPLLEEAARFQRCSTLAKMVAWAHATSAPKPAAEKGGGFSPRTAKRIARRLDQVIEQSGSLQDPEDRQQHHALRVAVKRLRYTMEIWRPLLGGDVDPLLDTYQQLQELLGTIHDCDILCDRLDQFLEEERQRTEEFFGHLQSFPRIERAVGAYRRQLQQERKEAFEQLREYWDGLTQQGFWQRLREMVCGTATASQKEPAANDAGPVAGSDARASQPWSSPVAGEEGQGDSVGKRSPDGNLLPESPAGEAG